MQTRKGATIALSFIALLAFSLFSTISISSIFVSSLNVSQAFGQQPPSGANDPAQSGRDNATNQSGMPAPGTDQQSGSMGAEAQTMYKAEYPKATADSRSSLVLQTEQRLYKPGEEVTIQGSIWSNLLTQLGEDVDIMTIQVADNRGTIVADEEVQIDNDGEYSMSFTLPNNARLGAYTINTDIEVDANILATLDASLTAKVKASSRFVVVSPVAFAVNAEGKQFNVNVASNSSIVEDFAFVQAEKKVSFTVEGETGTSGVAQVTLPKELLSGDLVVSIDGRVIAENSNDVIVTSDTTSEMTLEINYPHSEHTIEVTGTNVVPEFPLSLVVMAAAIGSILAIMAVGRGRIRALKK